MTKRRQRRERLRSVLRTLRAGRAFHREWNSIPPADPADFEGVILGGEVIFDRVVMATRDDQTRLVPSGDPWPTVVWRN